MATNQNKPTYNVTTERAMWSARSTATTFGVIFLIIAGLLLLALIFDAPSGLWIGFGAATMTGILLLLIASAFRWMARAAVAMETYIYNEAVKRAENMQKTVQPDSEGSESAE